MQMPLFTPPSDWVAPTEFPDLSLAKEVCIDCETKDPNLTSMGPGYLRGDGHVAGYAVAVDGASYYFPIRHELGPNLDVGAVKRFMAALCKIDRTYIFHNAPYDLGWLRADGITVGGVVRDTMVAYPLIDENRYSYSLNNLGKDFLSERKDERLLRDAARDFGIDAKSEMYKLPATFVGTYAEQDAALTLKLWHRAKELIAQEDLQSIFDLETAVQPVTLAMKYRGIRIDLEYAQKLKPLLRGLEQEVLQAIKKEHGFEVDVWSAASVAKLFDKIGLQYPRISQNEKNPDGIPSFTKEWLNANEHPVAQQIVRVRKISKASSTFIDAYLKHEINGRIHPEMHPLRSDEGGAVTGRFSYSDPNLQQVPSPDKDAEFAPLVRGLFLPEEGEAWGAFDYSSQEPRLLVHYAGLMNCRGAGFMVDSYNNDPLADFHQLCADICGVSRKAAKTINLGLFYGMGKNKMAAQLGIPYDEAQALFKQYHEKVPFVLEMSNNCTDRASARGVIRTLLGRKCRFDMWEPAMFGSHKALSHTEAFAQYGPSIKRAWTYRALNRLIQGSAADQTKQAMVNAFAAGHLPLVQVHDELGFSVSSKEQALDIKRIMEEAVPLSIPVLADAELGPSWGLAKTGIEEYFK
jgi:DNA polymerase I-like protein with 3'-5' exonuclease and polymerase domains